MEGGITICVDDRNLAAKLAQNLTTKLVAFQVTFHEGMMQWQFSVFPEDSTRVGEALADSLRYVS